MLTETYHILYVSFEESDGGRSYIGAHSTNDLNDGYLGSFSDKTFQPTNKIIVGFFKSREALIQAEIQFQRTFKVVENPEFANKSYQTSVRFCTAGATLSREHREKIKNSNKKTFQENKQERKKRSDRMKGENNPSIRCPPSKEQIEKRNRAVKDAWADPLLRKKHSELQKLLQNKPEVKVKRSNSIKKAINNEAELLRRKLESSGRRWYSNQLGERKFVKESPGENWKLGYYWTD